MRPFFEQLAYSTQQKKGVAVLILLLLLIQVVQWIHSTRSVQPLPSPSPLPLFTSTSTQEISPIGINSADTISLEGIPGIGSVLSRRIIRFRSLKKGFSSLEDLKEVYGLSQKTYSEILPYFYLDPIPEDLAERSEGGSFSRSFPAPVKSSLSPIDINQADEHSFRKLPGIGPVLSKRIVSYRQAKGGFNHPKELKQVYNLPDSTFKKILPYLFVSPQAEASGSDSMNKKDSVSLAPKVSRYTPVPFSPPPLAPINLNTADTSQLQHLPGIGSVLSKRIIAYRNIIGFFSKVEFVGKVYGIEPELQESLYPFLFVDTTGVGKKEDLNTIPEWKLKKYPFWLESELATFLLWKHKIRRVDSWEEVERARVVQEATLEQLKIYFDL